MRNGSPAVRLALLAVLVAPASRAAADLHFSQPQVNLGTQRTGVPLAHRFGFRNAGPGPVTVTDLRASCGCLAPRLDRRTFQPGEEGVILLEVNTLSQPAGANAWRVHVGTRADGQDRTHTLEVRADLVTEVKVEPATLTLSTDRPIRHEVTVTDTRAKALRVVQAHCSSTHVAARVLPAAEGTPPGAQKVGIEVTAGLPDGRHDETLSIFTDDPVYRELRVPVTVIKRPRQGVSASPAAVNLAAPQGRPYPSRVVLLRAEGEVQVERVEADDPAVTCRWARGPGKMATVRIAVDHARAGGPLRTAVRVHVSKPAASVVTIPVLCTPR